MSTVFLYQCANFSPVPNFPKNDISIFVKSKVPPRGFTVPFSRGVNPPASPNSALAGKPNPPRGCTTREQTGAVKLGRLLKSIGVDWEETDNPHIKQFQNGGDLITTISVEGYELAFWKKVSTMVDCTDIKTVSHDLSDLIGVEILPVHLSSLREGD